MVNLLTACASLLVCATLVQCAPAGSITVSAPSETATVSPAGDSPNTILWAPSSQPGAYQPIRGDLGANIIGPQNEPLQRENADLLAPPTTDHGTVSNFKWPFSLSHNRLQTGGWARQQNTDDMPAATGLASVNMRLEAGAVRELHWHTAAEWAYVLKGKIQVTSIDTEGRNYLATVQQGDLWYFPAGIPHSLQATADDPEGAEFLLVFPDGNFNEDGTFLLTDWFSHVPKEVLARNFQTPISAFDHIPSEQLYIFPAAPPSDDAKDVESPQGTVPDPFTFSLSQMDGTRLSGGSTKIADTRNFKVSRNISVADVTIEPGAMRELHWHPTQDEWGYVIEGEARMTVFAADSNARTFNYQAGDISYVPAAFGHYLENIGNTTVRFLEIQNSDRFEDVSLSQWLALTPPQLVKAHLGVDDAFIEQLQKFKVKSTIVGPAINGS